MKKSNKKVKAIDVIKGMPFFILFIAISILYFPVVLYKSIKHRK